MLKLALACAGGLVLYFALRQATIRQRRQVAVAWSNEPAKRIPVKGDPFSRTQEAIDAWEKEVNESLRRDA